MSRLLPAAPFPSAGPVIDVGPEPSLRRTMMAGAVAVVVGFGGFFGWALLADLDSAAIAPGTVIVDSKRKTVSHLEGGILESLKVREGDEVTAGQVLLTMDGTRARALVAQLESQYWAQAARAARLRAEQADSREFTAPDSLAAAAAADPVAAEALRAEMGLFAARWDSFDQTRAAQERRIAQLEEQVAALKSQQVATADRLGFTEEEMKAVKSLLDKGYERRPRYLELQRLTAELRGDLGEIRAKEAEAEEAIAAARLDLLNLASTRRSEIAAELQTAQTTEADLAERLRGARDVLNRLVVTAPQSGRVVDLRYVTPGGVIQPGAPILDIVPQDDELVVEAMVAPRDIDTIGPGREAHVRLSAYKQRQVPPVKGTVQFVSPDLLTDQRTGHTYYLTRVKLDAAELSGLADVQLYPGMPAEVMITGTPRKAIEYFISPLTDSMRRAFREE